MRLSAVRSSPVRSSHVTGIPAPSAFWLREHRSFHLFRRWQTCQTDRMVGLAGPPRSRTVTGGCAGGERTPAQGGGALLHHLAMLRDVQPFDLLLGAPAQADHRLDEVEDYRRGDRGPQDGEDDAV